MRTIRERLIHNPYKAGRLLGLYQAVLTSELRGNPLPFKGDRDSCEFLLSGIASNQQGYLKVKNPIYRLVFNEAWVEHQLSELRPYSHLLSQWLTENYDDTYLLRGADLQAAIAWSADRHLSDDDYRF